MFRMDKETRTAMELRAAMVTAAKTVNDELTILLNQVAVIEAAREVTNDHLAVLKHSALRSAIASTVLLVASKV
jgi:hypothetical protein